MHVVVVSIIAYIELTIFLSHKEGDAFLERQLNIVVDDLSGEFGKTFAGISVHHYNAYQSPFSSLSNNRVYCRGVFASTITKQNSNTVSLTQQLKTKIFHPFFPSS